MPGQPEPGQPELPREPGRPGRASRTTARITTQATAQATAKVDRARATGSDPAAPPPLTPGQFAREVLGVELWARQEEVLAALPERRRVAVKSGNGLGKGFSAAVAGRWLRHRPDPASVRRPAPTISQVRHILWRQIHSLHRRAAGKLGGKLLDTRWELADDRYAMGLSADTADQFQGFHSPNMLIVVDEAEGVSDEIYEAIEAVMTSDASRLLLIGNPTTAAGAFRRAFYQERNIYHCITISALDSPNVQAGRVVIPGLATARWVEERRQIWGAENPLYRARVLGEFPDQAEDTLIRLSDIEAAARRYADSGVADSREAGTGEVGDFATRPAPDSPVRPTPVEGSPAGAGPARREGTNRETARNGAAGAVVILAVDVARFGSDRSVILRRRGRQVEEIRIFNRMDTMELAGWVAAAIREFQPSQTCIDEVGVGAGVVDRLREQGYGVRGINVAHAARQKEIFANLRAEGYWRLRELFAAGEISIPPDQQLMGELAALRYSYDSQGRILLESKETLRQRGIPSPDKADALMLAFVEPVSRARLWT